MLAREWLWWKQPATDQGNTIVQNLSIRSSVDSFAMTLDSQSVSERIGTSGLSGGSFDLPALPVQRGSVELRIYFFGDQNSQFSKVGIASIALNATVIPEPSGAGRLLLAGGILVARRKW